MVVSFSLSLSFVIAQGLILVIFYKMHQSVINDDEATMDSCKE